MNFDRLNQWLTLFANLGVLVGIVFLAIEMNQNTAMMRAQTRDAITEKQMSFYSQILTDAQVTENFITSLGIDEEFNLANSQARNLYRTQLRMWENEWYQYQQGLFEDEEFEPRMNLWRGVLSSRNYMDFWSTVRVNYSPEFREQIDMIVSRINEGSN